MGQFCVERQFRLLSDLIDIYFMLADYLQKHENVQKIVELKNATNRLMK